MTKTMAETCNEVCGPTDCKGKCVAARTASLMVELLRKADRWPRSYRANAAEIDRCVSVSFDGDSFKLAMDMVAAASPELLTAMLDAGTPRCDSLGMGMIAFWPGLPWPKGEVE